MNKPVIYVAVLIILSMAALLNFLFVYPFLLIQYTIYIFILTGLFFNILFSFFAIRKKYPLIIVSNIFILIFLTLFIVYVYLVPEGLYPAAIDLFSDEVNP
ncbi:hypothetical protein [Oceanobacillus sp. CFH 90083]|uniref:hypothetical protein n=1 Tax=Oceanobacillus sp. CFH 90083 TaxID=2592336 RepID=UPI00128C4DFB|nr:hypothetical protein [Oceanobacillus sp. CFH 90083]